MDKESVDELKRELQNLEESLNIREHDLEMRRQSARSLNADISVARSRVSDSSEAKAASQQSLREASRQKQVLENERRSFDNGPAHQQTREEYVGQLMEGEENRQNLEEEITDIATKINDLKEKRSEAQKRLTVVRLMSMLDDLQASLNAKVNDSDGGAEEARAQELIKAIQELSRERERTLMLLTRKEAEVASAVELKKKRLAELRLESDRNRGALAESNDAEVYGVMERIQKERRLLMQDIERLEETNEQLERVLVDTKYSVKTAASDRKAALAADDAMGTSRDPEGEKRQLRERIVAANAERRRYELKTEAVQRRAETEIAQYDAKMSALLKEILMYEEENSKLKKGNVSLEALCDSIAATLED